MISTGRQMQPIDIILEIAAVLAFLSPFAMMYFYWNLIPDRVPLHFDFSGNINSWRTKESLFIAPAVSIGCFILLTFFASPYMSPEFFNLPKGVDRNNPETLVLVRRMLRWLKLLTSMVMATVVWMQIQGALQNPAESSEIFIWILVGIVFVMIFYYLLRMKRVSALIKI